MQWMKCTKPVPRRITTGVARPSRLAKTKLSWRHMTLGWQIKGERTKRSWPTLILEPGPISGVLAEFLTS